MAQSIRPSSSDSPAQRPLLPQLRRLGFFALTFAGAVLASAGSDAIPWLGEQSRLILLLVVVTVAARWSGPRLGFLATAVGVAAHLLLSFGSLTHGRLTGEVSTLLVAGGLGLLIIEMSSALQASRRRAEEQRKALANHQGLYDPLTALPNRALFLNRLEQALRGLDRRRELIAVMFLDLDQFKGINDTLGHGVGDELLRGLAARYQECLRRGDTLARFGGDEFTALLVGLNHPRVARQIAQRFLDRLQAPFQIAGHQVQASVSIGIAYCQSAATPAEELLRQADQALYHAKRAGRGGYALFEAAADEAAQGRAQLEKALAGALENEELRVHYQPEVELKTGKIVGVEALVRWQHPDRGLLMPAEFLSIAQDTGLMYAVGSWVRREACRQAAAWNAAGKSGPLIISTNVTAQELAHPELIPEIRRILNDTALDPGQLQLEIPESVLVEQPALVSRLLPALKALRVRVLIDDFGAGYSPLGCLRQFPVDGLKIDRGLTQGLSADAGLRHLVRALAELAGAMQLRVIAEGIEGLDQLDCLVAFGCAHGQGYYLHQPDEPRAIEQLLV